MTEIPKSYDPAVEEKKWQLFWKENNIYTLNTSSTKPVYSIDTPPPTMSGRMHLGHSFSYAQQDIIARYKRMQGFEVFYPFGTDDNGLPTEKLVQKEKKVNATKMDRQEFIDLCQQYLKEHRETFIQDWRDLGLSSDFDLNYSTINDHSRKIAQKTFLDLVKQKKVYRKQAPVIWDTVFQTAIAQAELESVERDSYFNDIVFKLEDGKELIIATTRPELLGGCVAIFAHPDDKRYQQYFGKFATSPLYNVKVPILADEAADPKKGTGIVMCCTFGDQTDIEWFKKHDLPLRMMINKDGTMSDASGKYAGMKIPDAKKQIIEDLKDAGLLKKQEKIKQIVNVGERSGMPVEIFHSTQWYVDYLELKQDFLKGSEQLVWHPYHMKHRLDNWIKGLNWDWSISRQRSYGVPIPAWYDKQGHAYYADETQLPVDPLKDRPLSAPPGVELIPETDVFDTWFTSASTPFLAGELVEDTPLAKKVFPMSLRPQAHDIINFWLFYTMAKTRILHGVNPWKEVTVSGFVLDPKGNKMSKSKGNAISPQDTMHKYGADNLRFWAATSNLGDDLPYMEKDLLTGKKTINKLWNAARFASMHLENYDGKEPELLQALDDWVLGELDKTIIETREFFDNYQFARGKMIIEQFFWKTFCDNYLEIVKGRLYNPDIYGEDAKVSAQYALTKVFLGFTKLLAPIMPFITEAVYQYFFKRLDANPSSSIHLSTWDQVTQKNARPIDDTATIAVEIISAARRIKAKQQKSLGTPITKMTIYTLQSELEKNLADYMNDITGATKTSQVLFEHVEAVPDGNQNSEPVYEHSLISVELDTTPKQKKQ